MRILDRMVVLPSLTVDHEGRQLNVWLSGAEAGPVLLYQPGTPAPPVRWESLERLASELGLRLASYARPGYSGSTRDEGRSVADAASDVGAVMDTLGVQTFTTFGHSGGGPHALACAALLPDRCVAAATLASVAPYDLYEGDWSAGMADANVEEFEWVIGGPDGLEAYLSSQLEGMAGVNGIDVDQTLGDLISQVDREELTGDIAEVIASWFRQTAVDGLHGWLDDDLAFIKPWGFRLDSISTHVTLWHGLQDRMVPLEHGRWLADNIPKAGQRFFDDEGHISMMTRGLRRIITELLDQSTTQISG